MEELDNKLLLGTKFSYNYIIEYTNICTREVR